MPSRSRSAARPSWRSTDDGRGGDRRGHLRLAHRGDAIGRAIAEAEDDPVSALVAVVDGARLLDGKIVDVERRTTAGFARGSARSRASRRQRPAARGSRSRTRTWSRCEGGLVRASVPDLITVVDSTTGEAIATERVRYGQRVP